MRLKKNGGFEMNALNLHKAYAIQGMTLELAELCEARDLIALKKVERAFADAIVEDLRQEELAFDCEPPTMKARIGNITRDTYLDVYRSEAVRKSYPRGVIVSYPDGRIGGGRWYRREWTTDTHHRFDSELDSACEAVKRDDNPRFSTIVKKTAGLAWMKAVKNLVNILEKRASAEKYNEPLAVQSVFV